VPTAPVPVGLTQRVIGERLGISQMHVSRLIRTSIAGLQQAQQPRRQAGALQPGRAGFGG
jgi:hypothetical protein